MESCGWGSVCLDFHTGSVSRKQHGYTGVVKLLLVNLRTKRLV